MKSLDTFVSNATSSTSVQKSGRRIRMIVKRKSTGGANGLTIGFEGLYREICKSTKKKRKFSKSAQQAIILFAKVHKL